MFMPLNHLPQMVWTALPDGQVNWFNGQWYAYTGVKPGDVNWDSIVHPTEIKEVHEIWGHAIETGTQYQKEMRLRAVDGTYRWFLARALPVKDDFNNIIQWLGTATDITDIMKLEQELAYMNRVLSQSLTSLDQFALAASEAIQATLASFVKCTSLLHKAKSTEEELLAIEEMYSSTGKLGNLVVGLTRYSKAISPDVHITEMDLNTLVKNVLDDLQTTVKDTGAEISSVGILPFYRGDCDKLTKLFQNLISNAIKYGGAPPKIVIEYSEPELSAYWEVRITDNGSGINNPNRAFEPFYSNNQSAGVGLAICKSVLDYHHGTIWIEKTGPNGTTIAFKLPKIPTLKWPLPNPTCWIGYK